jgi:NADH-quinone oxidoreductase subunit L
MYDTLLWSIVLLPLIGATALGLFGSQLQPILGKRGVGVLAVLPILLAFVCGLLLTQELLGMTEAGRRILVTGPDWIAVNGFRMPFEWVADPLSMTMVLIITGIGALIHIYATGYMAEDRDYTRFFAYLNLFVAAMLVLVLGNNLGLLFVGWEGVGLCSYLLIGFWYKDRANSAAANKAFIANRIGDWCLMLAMFLIAVAVLKQLAGGPPDGRVLSFDVIMPNLLAAMKAEPGLATAIGLLLFGAAAGKSAQFPLYVWLPDAMAGPTPVSALIHAATMVTSGVVLLTRMNIVFQMSPVASAVVCGIGAFTALFAALVALGQTDIKKVLAYSTVSQLGFMFIGVGAGGYWSGMFHVTTHAFFKALLFLGAGAVIHAMLHEQDMRRYGNLRKYLPITFGTMVVGWLAISGVMPLAGFYSKEVILGYALANDHAGQVSQIAGWTGLFVAALTALYMTRLTMLTFFGDQERWRSAEPAVAHAHATSVAPAAVPELDEAFDDRHRFYTAYSPEPEEEDDHGHALTKDFTPKEVGPSMWVPLVVLAALSLAGGFLLYQNHTFQHWLQPFEPAVIGKLDYEYPNLLALSLGAAAAGLVLGFLFYRNGLPQDQGWNEARWSPFRRAARDQFGFDRLVSQDGSEGARDLAGVLNRWVDGGLITGAVDGSATAAGGIGELFRRIQTGAVRFYALMMLLGGLALIAWFVFVVQNGGAQ